MNFKDWCLHEFGILDFTEGKIPNSVFIPAQSNMLMNYFGITTIGGGVINTPDLQGMIIPFNVYQQLKQSMYECFYAHYGEDPNDCNEWLNSFFTVLGLNSGYETEYKEPSAIHITFRNQAEQDEFLNRFQSFNPIPGFNVLSQKNSLQLPAHFISFLQQLYYKSPHAEIKNPKLIVLMLNQFQNLKALTGMIETNRLQVRLDYANFLSKDFSNTSSNGSALYDELAASAYSISLRVYAEINRDNLSECEYQNFNYAASILAAYDELGNLKQGLKTDSKFVKHIKDLYVSSKGKRVQGIILGDLPKLHEHILSLINQNILIMFFGNSEYLEHNVNYSVSRFLPDTQMHSETDEIIFQGGGSSTHSAIYRIVKVGILSNGQRAGPDEMPHFYEYYKIEDNLGLGCHEVDLVDKTCTGTYITQLTPFTIVSGQVVPVDIDPYLQPLAYQYAMIFTLSELIRVERQLILYPNPELDLINNSAALGQSNEAKEWIRLNKMKEILSGQPYPEPLVYYTQDPLEPSKRYQRTVLNQRNYIQEGGSCLIFSLKSLVSSIIGMELTTLHNNFMQLHNGELHLAMTREKINQLRFRLAQSLTPVIDLIQSQREQSGVKKNQPQFQNKISFFGRNLYGIEMLRNSSLQGSSWISSITVTTDPIDTTKRILNSDVQMQK